MTTAAEAKRLAKGWRWSLQVFERQRRLVEGEPLLRIVRNEPAADDA